jgi:phosphoserine aminotransferase
MSPQTAVDRVFNFSAGPAAMPLPVLEQIQRDLLVLPGCGASILEISHRSRQFGEILAEAQQRLRDLLDVPETHRILFLQGGSRLQFSMVPMNLLGGVAGEANYILTGAWGKKALAEATKAGATHVVWDGKTDRYARLPSARELQFSDQPAYVHYTSNETIEGVQFAGEPVTDDPRANQAPLVCDASSDFLSRPLPVNKYGLLYACAQKNAGPAGVTIVIIRADLLERSQDALPGYLNYRLHAKENSLYNTPCTFGIYAFSLIARWLQDEVGGLSAMAQQNARKASMLYEVIDARPEFYSGHADPACRSRMNVTFRLPDDQLQADFLAEASQRQLETLKGHRSVGGIRASIYNAMPVAGVEALRDFMVEFRDQRAG